MTPRALPLAYVARSLLARRVTTVLTAAGLALVVWVFATVLMLAQGLRDALVATGRADNVTVIRRSSQTEVQSAVDRTQAAVVAALPGIAIGRDGAPMVAREVVVLVSLPRLDPSGRAPPRPANVTVRGTTPVGIALRPGLRPAAGRWFRPGTAEVTVGRAIAAGFGAAPGTTLRFGGRDWTVTGIVDAGGSAFDSEVWGDVDTMAATFRRQAFSSVTFRLADADGFDGARHALEDDPRLTVEAKPEIRFWADQSEALSNFLEILGRVLSAIFSIAAVVGATITMHASVASRTAEIGTLRALGFGRTAILLAFLAEAALLGAAGGVLGLAGAAAMQGIDVSTMNWQTFSELSFGFRLGWPIALQALAFGLGMGLAGGALPALRAARMPIVEALRAA